MLAQEETIQENFDSQIIREIWRKGEVIFDIDPDIIRRDFYGDWIKKDDYDNPNSVYGWTIEQVVPTSKGGNGEIKNLRPLHWKNRK